MFSKKKKKPLISMPSNFEHRVHTGFDKREQRYVGLPLQWASIVGNNQILKSTNRPLPLVDPSEITPTEILDLKTIVRPHHNNNKSDATSLNSSIAMQTTGGAGIVGDLMGGVGQHSQAMNSDNASAMAASNATGGGIVLPKTSHVARSNSLRSSSPPKIRRDLRGNANVPPAVPEESINSGPLNVMSGHLVNTNIPGYKPSQQMQQTTVNNIVQGGVTGHGLYLTQSTQNGVSSGGPLAVRTDFGTQPAPNSIQFRPGQSHLHAQQTSPAGSIANNTRSTHSHISSHSHGHLLNNNTTPNMNNMPMYPSPQGQINVPLVLPPHGQLHQQQQQMQHLAQQQQIAKSIVSGGVVMGTDQNQNPHHIHLHAKTASRASSSSGGASGIAATNATGGSTATAAQPKQEPRLTHEQVNTFNLLIYMKH